MATLLSLLAADRLALLVLVAGLGTAAFVVLSVRPRLAVAAWFAVICFVPCWIEVQAVVSFSAAVVLAVLLMLTLLAARPAWMSATDWVVGGLFIMCLAPIALHTSSKTAAFVVITQWLVGYVVGRLIAVRVGLDWVYRCAAASFACVAVLGLAEYVFGWNPFVHLRMNNIDFATWSPLQSRGGSLRVEGAFGHSLALGACVAMAIPLVLASSLRLTHRLTIVLLLLSVEVVTFSRAAMISAILAVLLVAISRDDTTRRIRLAVLGMTGLIAVAAIPLLSDTYTAAGAEATDSADYRLRLASLVSDISLLGRSESATVTSGGTLFFGHFKSIDSAFLLTGLTYGLLPLLIALALTLGGVYLVVIRRAEPATIAIVSQIPVLFTVAPITQFQIFFWFMSGLAVYSQAARAMRERPARSVPGRTLVSGAPGHGGRVPGEEC